MTLDLTTVLGLFCSFTRESSMLLLAETALPKLGILTDGTLGLGFSSPNKRSIHRLAEVFRVTTGLFFSSLVQRDVVLDLIWKGQCEDEKKDDRTWCRPLPLFSVAPGSKVLGEKGRETGVSA